MLKPDDQSKAPDFVLMDQDNNKVRLSDIIKQKKATILAFYILDFTDG